MSTPTQVSKQISKSSEEYSPLFLIGSQEDVDVEWDWNSPQTKQKPIRNHHKQKRLILEKSPQVPTKALKRHPSNNQINTFDEIKLQLQALRENIVKEETRNKENYLEFEVSIDGINKLPHLDCVNNFQTFLADDSIEEQLLLCSQEVESKIIVNSSENFTKHNINTLINCDKKKNLESDHLKNNFNNNKLKSVNVNFNKKGCYNSKFNCNLRETKSEGELKSIKNIKIEDEAFGDDSFESVLAEFDDDELLSQAICTQNVMMNSNEIESNQMYVKEKFNVIVTKEFSLSSESLKLENKKECLMEGILNIFLMLMSFDI